MGKIGFCGVSMANFEGLNDRLEKEYRALSPKEQSLLLYLAQGYKWKDALKLSGYSVNSSGIKNIYARKPVTREIVHALKAYRAEQGLNQLLSTSTYISDEVERQNTLLDISKDYGALSKEEQDRIRFYKSIVDGNIKTVKVVRRYDADGKLIDRRIETGLDIDARIKARKELDAIIGVNKVNHLGQLSAGNITVNILNTGRRDDVDELRAKLDKDMADNTVEIGGEKMYVAEDEAEIIEGISIDDEVGAES